VHTHIVIIIIIIIIIIITKRALSYHCNSLSATSAREQGSARVPAVRVGDGGLGGVSAAVLARGSPHVSLCCRTAGRRCSSSSS
jgi:uncharacterized protein YpmB